MRQAAALLVLALAAACAPLRALESLNLLLALSAAPPAGPIAQPLSYQGRDGPRQADLYRARDDDGTEPGLVLVPGLTPAGKDDARLVGFARQLAGAGFAVLVPEIASLRALRADPDDARPIADAVARLAALSGRPVGLAAISYAAGPALLAALEEESRGHLAFLLVIGGYHDAEAAIGFAMTGASRGGPGQPWQRREPHPYALWAFVRGNSHAIADRRDRTSLRAMAERRLRDPAAPIADLAAGLGPEGHSVLALLRNRDPERLPSLLAGLPAGVRANISALDLKRRDLSAITVPAILVHGRDDPMIPYRESVSLAGALPDGRAELYLVDSLSHVDLGAVGLSDGLTLWRAIYRVLDSAERGPGKTVEHVR